MRKILVLTLLILATAAGVATHLTNAVTHGSASVTLAEDGWPVGHG